VTPIFNARRGDADGGLLEWGEGGGGGGGRGRGRREGEAGGRGGGGKDEEGACEAVLTYSEAMAQIQV
jgi:hypothetical protein